MTEQTEIAAPVTKAVTALSGAGATKVLATQHDASAFWPATASEWFSLCASAAALIYTTALLIEWCWKRFVRDLAVRRGWVSPRPDAPTKE